MSGETKTNADGELCCQTTLSRKFSEYVHLSLGHLGVDKCLEEIKYVFHVKDLGRKLRKFIAYCLVCQKTKHPNRSVDVEEKHHFPKKPGDVCAVDIYGSLPMSRGGVRYILVCLDVFSRSITLYALKSATTKACLNKLTSHYFGNVTAPKIILSDNATQFRSPGWRKQLQKQGVKTRFTPIRHPESNPSERYMRELSKFCRIYCNENHKKWAELLTYIESWINNTVASATGYTPSELMYGSERCNVLSK
jgi:transposase InsO family protein